jgi:hypothetical protein
MSETSATMNLSRRLALPDLIEHPDPRRLPFDELLDRLKDASGDEGPEAAWHVGTWQGRELIVRHGAQPTAFVQFTHNILRDCAETRAIVDAVTRTVRDASVDNSKLACHAAWLERPQVLLDAMRNIESALPPRDPSLVATWRDYVQDPLFVEVPGHFVARQRRGPLDLKVALRREGGETRVECCVRSAFARQSAGVATYRIGLRADPNLRDERGVSTGDLSFDRVFVIVSTRERLGEAAPREHRFAIRRRIAQDLRAALLAEVSHMTEVEVSDIGTRLTWREAYAARVGVAALMDLATTVAETCIGGAAGVGGAGPYR